MDKGNKKQLTILCLIIVLSLLLTGKGITAGKRKSDRLGADISLCTIATGIFDKSYNESTWNTLMDLNGEYPELDINYYTPKEQKDSDLMGILRMASKGDPEIIITSSFQYGRSVGKAQYLYPDINYLFIDSVPIDEYGNEDIAENTIAVSFVEQESGFLAGYAAVKDGYRNLGFVGGMAIPSVRKFGYGFLYGANEAAKDLGLPKGSVEIKYTYVGTFNPSPEIMSLATSWYEGGTEVIFPAAGGGSASVIKAAEQSGKKVIGVDSDMSEESETVITSAMKDVSSVLRQIIIEYMEDDFYGGVNKVFSAKDHGVGLPMETSRFREFDQKQYEEIFQRIVDGEFEMETDVESPEDLKLENVLVNEY